MPKFAVSLALVLLVVAAVPASANHLVGIKVVATEVNPSTRSVAVDFTLYTSEESPGSGTTSDVTLFWGDGEGTEEADATLVPSAGPLIYRGSMSHTYEEAEVEGNDGEFTIRVRECCKDESVTSEELVTGRANAYPSYNATYSPTSPTGTITNTTMISFNDNLLAVPTASGIGLLLLSAMLGVGGLLLLRR